MPEPGGIMAAIGAGQVDQGGTVVTGRLPDEGSIRIGSVTLPAGRLITGWHGSDHHVARVTADPVPDSGQVWAALSELHPQTGLVPIQLDGLLGGLPHDARHAAATLLLAQGVDQRVVMEILGHSQISMTSRYAHVLPQVMTDAAERIGQALWG